jgi:hypothetical protein
MANHVVAWPWWLYVLGVFVLIGVVGSALTILLYAAAIILPIVGVWWLVAKAVEIYDRRGLK